MKLLSPKTPDNSLQLSSNSFKLLQSFSISYSLSQLPATTFTTHLRFVTDPYPLGDDRVTVATFHRYCITLLSPKTKTLSFNYSTIMLQLYSFKMSSKRSIGEEWKKSKERWKNRIDIEIATKEERCYGLRHLQD